MRRESHDFVEVWSGLLLVLLNFEESYFACASSDRIQIKLAILHHKFMFQRSGLELMIACHRLQIPKFEEQILIFTTSNQVTSLDFAQSKSTDWILMNVK